MSTTIDNFSWQWVAYHPAIFERLVPADKQETEQDVTLIPACPCCGEGRTLFCHFKKTTDLVVPSSFKDWCRPCRERLAAQADKFRASLRDKP
jgi:hypothetical protein